MLNSRNQWHLWNYEVGLFSFGSGFVSRIPGMDSLGYPNGYVHLLQPWSFAEESCDDTFGISNNFLDIQLNPRPWLVDLSKNLVFPEIPSILRIIRTFEMCRDDYLRRLFFPNVRFFLNLKETISP